MDQTGTQERGNENWLREIGDGFTEVNSPFLSDLCSCSGRISKLNVKMKLKTPKESDTDVRVTILHGE